MRIAICDDDDFFRAEALSATEEYIARSGNAISTEVFSHAEDLLEAVSKHGGFDLYILDVVMPEVDGIALGKQLREIGCDGKIIYLTSSDEFALHSYQVKAFDYLLKPIDNKRFFECVDAAVCEILEKRSKSILVKTKASTVKVGLDSILYASLNRRIIEFYLSNGKKLESTQVRSSFAEATDALREDPRFFRFGASLVLNLANISEIDSELITFKGGTTLSLSKKNLREVRSKWCEFCLDEVKIR
ncbi:MAG: response regulator transcription factor [Oscillospiraceae bacterium]|nr:response regulator transcription factor [Oscillospiraceae bacterium]